MIAIAIPIIIISGVPTIAKPIPAHPILHSPLHGKILGIENITPGMRNPARAKRHPILVY
jgi:hypothetical protein